MKNLQFIPLSKISEFFAGKIEEVSFEKSVLYDKSSPSRNGIAEDNGLFSVAITKFLDNCGLYFIVKMPEDKKEWFDNLVKSLGLSGIGGKRTSGYGQFKIEYEVLLEESSNIKYEATMAKYLNKEGQYNLLLSAFYPQKNEIEKIKNGYYTLIQRQGFVQSTTYSDTILKKLPTAMINAGSCFEEKFKGDIIDVSNDGKHPVYRYGKPIMIGIDL